MMNGGGPKENANPVVREIDNKPKRNPLGWSEIEAIGADPAVDVDNIWASNALFHRKQRRRSAVDQAVLKALADASEATEGKGVSLLQNVGVSIPESSAKVSSLNFEFIPKFATVATGNPFVATEPSKSVSTTTATATKEKRDVVDNDEIFDIIRNIQDPEHPLTLEQLGVVSRNQITVNDILDYPETDRIDFSYSTIDVRFTPTIPHCSMATLIGLSIRVKLYRSVPARFKVTVRIEPGTHVSEHSVNKQLADKERVCAALENTHLLDVVNKCIKNGMTGDMS